MKKRIVTWISRLLIMGFVFNMFSYKSFSVIISCFLIIHIISGCQLFHSGTDKQGLFEDRVLLQSPERSVLADILIDGESMLFYQLSFNGEQVVLPSRLGIVIGGQDYGSDAVILGAEFHTIDETYGMIGRGLPVHHRSNRVTIELGSSNGEKRWYLECEASERGFAFRHRIPGSGARLVEHEYSAFRLPDHSRIWYFERDNHWKLQSYAGEWVFADISEMPEISPGGPIQGPPLVADLPEGGYVLLSESACYDYSGMRLRAIGNNTFMADMADEEGFVLEGEIVTPWRVVMCAASLDALVNNTMIDDLAPGPDPELYSDISYISPGRSVWRWWSLRLGTPEEEMQFIDYAQELGYEYTIIDDGWEYKWPDKWNTVTHVVNYAGGRDVRVFLWKHSKEIRDPSGDFAVMRAWLDSIAATGAAGIKVDFMNAETKEIITFENRLLREAAKRRLMVNFHGCSKPKGEARTFPNEVTREGIRGLELNYMGEGPLPAWHNAALPFTRFVTGHGDYTPLGFTAPGPTTWAHQLATLILFDSPKQVIAEYPGFILNNAQVNPALDFIKTFPVVWDETVVLPGSSIGELAAIARRAGDHWYVGFINGDEAKTYTLRMKDFLPGGRYEAVIFRDDLESEKVNIVGLHQLIPRKEEYPEAIPFLREDMVVRSRSTIQIDMAKGGGCVIILKKAQ